jgi:hypothetical protein
MQYFQIHSSTALFVSRICPSSYRQALGSDFAPSFSLNVNCKVICSLMIDEMDTEGGT